MPRIKLTIRCLTVSERESTVQAVQRYVAAGPPVAEATPRHRLRFAFALLRGRLEVWPDLDEAIAGLVQDAQAEARRSGGNREKDSWPS